MYKIFIYQQEDISDENYTKLHSICEEKEKEDRENFFKKKNKNKPNRIELGIGNKTNGFKKIN